MAVGNDDFSNPLLNSEVDKIGKNRPKGFHENPARER